MTNFQDLTKINQNRVESIREEAFQEQKHEITKRSFASVKSLNSFLNKGYYLILEYNRNAHPYLF